MQVSRVNLLKNNNVQSSSLLKRNSSELRDLQSDSIKLSLKQKPPVYEQGSNYIRVVSFGQSLTKPSNKIRAAIQMRVRGVTSYQPSEFLTEEKAIKNALKDSVNTVYRIAQRHWHAGDKLKYAISIPTDESRKKDTSKAKIKLFSEQDGGQIGRVPDEIVPFIIGLLAHNPKDYEFELSNVVAGTTKGAATTGLRVNLLYKGNKPDNVIDAFNSVLEDSKASQQAFFYQPVSTPRDVLEEILNFETKDNGSEASVKQKEILDNIVNTIADKKYEKILVVGHIKPDGDSTGSSLGLKNAIEILYPDKKVDCAVDDDVPGLFRHKLPGVDNTMKHPYSQEKIALLQEELNKSKAENASEGKIKGLTFALEKATNKDLLIDKNDKYDLVILVDVPSPARFSSGFKDFIENAQQTIYLDHHPLREEEWDKAKDSMGVDMRKIMDNKLAWIEERVPAAAQLIAVVASKLPSQEIFNPFNPDNTIKTIISAKSQPWFDHLKAATASLVTGIWTDTGAFSRTANLIPKDYVDENGKKVPVQQRPNFLPEGLSKWLMALTNGEIDGAWMHKEISYDIPDKKTNSSSLSKTSREKMIEIANKNKYENLDNGLGVVVASYDEMNEIWEMAKKEEPDLSFLDIQNAFKYSEVMGNYRSSTELQIIRQKMSNKANKSTEQAKIGLYDKDKIAVFVCQAEKANDLNTEGKRAKQNGIRFSFRSQEGTTHSELLATLFNGGGHGNAAGGYLSGDDITVNSKFAVKVNDKIITDGNDLYAVLQKNYDIMRDNKLNIEQQKNLRAKIELVKDDKAGNTPVEIIDQIVTAIRDKEKKESITDWY